VRGGCHVPVSPVRRWMRGICSSWNLSAELSGSREQAVVVVAAMVLCWRWPRNAPEVGPDPGPDQGQKFKVARAPRLWLRFGVWLVWPRPTSFFWRACWWPVRDIPRWCGPLKSPRRRLDGFGLWITSSPPPNVRSNGAPEQRGEHRNREQKPLVSQVRFAGWFISRLGGCLTHVTKRPVVARTQPFA